ncbi:hypothetical protein QOT17_008403 [Balamuthia mandrillaris]
MLTRCDLDDNPLAALPCTVVQLLPRIQTHSPQPFQQQAALLAQPQGNNNNEQEEQAKEEKEKNRATPSQSPFMRKNQVTVKSLWQLSGETVLRNQLLPTGLLTPVPASPFTWLSSSSSSSLPAERSTNQLHGTKERNEEGDRSVESAEVVLPEDVRERLERLQQRCDVCEQLFLEAEEEAEEEEEGREGREVVKRYWDEERRVWWELLCCSQNCLLRPLPASSLAIK